jgi:chorismate mutase
MLFDILSRLEIRDLLKTPYQSLALESLRMKMDSIDEQLIELLKGRNELSKAIALYKKDKGLTVLQIERYREIVKTRLMLSDDLGLDRDFIRAVLEQVHKESIRVQTDVMNTDTSSLEA